MKKLLALLLLMLPLVSISQTELHDKFEQQIWDSVLKIEKTFYPGILDQIDGVVAQCYERGMIKDTTAQAYAYFLAEVFRAELDSNDIYAVVTYDYDEANRKFLLNYQNAFLMFENDSNLKNSDSDLKTFYKFLIEDNPGNPIYKSDEEFFTKYLTEEVLRKPVYLSVMNTVIYAGLHLNHENLEMQKEIEKLVPPPPPPPVPGMRVNPNKESKEAPAQEEVEDEEGEVYDMMLDDEVDLDVDFGDEPDYHLFYIVVHSKDSFVFQGGKYGMDELIQKVNSSISIFKEDRDIPVHLHVIFRSDMIVADVVAVVEKGFVGINFDEVIYK